jgi:flagellar basal body rod protein FlgC
MQVAGARLNATANNTANWSTDGYREIEVHGVEDAAGVKPQIRRAPNPGGDPVANALELKGAYLMYRANLVVVDRADELLGQTMDLLA